jgi:hypothetical protein
VADEHERDAAASILRRTGALMSQCASQADAFLGRNATGNRRGTSAAHAQSQLEQVGLWSQIANMLLHWLAAGPPGDCSLCDSPNMRSALEALPESASEDHRLIAVSQQLMRCT